MQARKKENSILTTRIISPTQLGFTVVGYEEQVLDLTKVHPDNRVYAEFHGWGQRVPDKAAVPAADKDRNIIPAKERLRMKQEGIAAVIAHYESGSGSWTMRGEGRLAAGMDHTFTVQAVADVQRISVAAAHAYIDSHAKQFSVSRSAVLDTFADQPKFAARISELRRARVEQSGVDVERLLAGLPIAE